MARYLNFFSYMTKSNVPVQPQSSAASLPQVPTAVAFVVPENPPPPRVVINLNNYVREFYVDVGDYSVAEHPYADVPEPFHEAWMLCVKQDDCNTNANNAPVQKQAEAPTQPQGMWVIGGLVSVCTTVITARLTTKLLNSAENLDADDWTIIDKPFVSSHEM